MLIDAKESTRMKSPAAHLKWSGGGHASSTARMVSFNQQELRDTEHSSKFTPNDEKRMTKY